MSSDAILCSRSTTSTTGCPGRCGTYAKDANGVVFGEIVKYVAAVHVHVVREYGDDDDDAQVIDILHILSLVA